jgi:hypothetical protein
MILSAPFISKKLIDADATAFVAASGATDFDAINRFVIGMKTLGLYNSMVCWPLRSTQNAGTGSTAYSLGGLGTYNGTLVNGPTWGADGVNFNSASARIAVTLSLSQPLTVIGVANFKTLTDGGSIIDGSSNRITLFNGSNSAKTTLFAGADFLNSSNSYTANANLFTAGYANGTDSVVYLNGTAATAANAGTSGIGPTVIIGNNTVFNFGDKNIDIAFCAIFNGQAYNDTVRALYKSTLGQGLGLS